MGRFDHTPQQRPAAVLAGPRGSNRHSGITLATTWRGGAAAPHTGGKGKTERKNSPAGWSRVARVARRARRARSAVDGPLGAVLADEIAHLRFDDEQFARGREPVG